MVKRSPYVPERGDIVWMNLNPALGHEQKGRRPSLVISPKFYNQKAGLVLICPITSKAKGYGFEVALQTNLVQGVVLTDQLRTVDMRVRKMKLMGRAPVATMELVTHMIVELVRGETLS